MVVSRKMAVFWVVAPCRLVEVYQNFIGPFCLYHQGIEEVMMEVTGTSETLFYICQTTLCYKPEDNHFFEYDFNKIVDTFLVCLVCRC
jgi:hypothetical protein